jgi:nickel-dependent lactate racemase
MHLAKVFGEHLPKMRDRLTVHIAQDPTLAVPIGRDRFDKEVFLNRRVAEAEQIVVISSVEPHYFAGFTGGRKSFFPGSTDLATIERNHNMAASLGAQPMRLDGNPVAEHLDQLLDLINTDKLFSIQVVNDAESQIVGLFAGDIRGSFYEAVRLATEVYSYTAAEPYDLVLAEMRAPLDANLYQAQKALENTQMTVRLGGACVVVSACAGGIGSEHFYNLADNWDRTTNRPLNGPPRFGSHKLSRVNEMSRKITVGLKSELDPETVSHVFYEPISDLDQFIADRSRNSKNYRVAVVKDAGNTVLKMK